MYAAIAQAPDLLWEIEPCTGFFLAAGLPKISIPGMQRVKWVATACHFVSGIRTASGISNFWVRANDISHHARMTALKMTLKTMHCVFYEEAQPYNADRWKVTPAGLAAPTGFNFSTTSLGSKVEHTTGIDIPSSRDFLLFAAIDYHVFREWNVNVYSRGRLVFSSDGMPPSSIVDVGSPEEALPVVIAQMVRRPQSQSCLRAIARIDNQGDTDADVPGPYDISIEDVPRNIPVCSIDFHSYAPESYKVSATIEELASAYHKVVQYTKHRAPNFAHSSNHNQLATIDVGQTLWIAIFGGALFDRGRLTIQNLPGRMSIKGLSADEAYLERLEGVLRLIEPHGMTSTFTEIVHSNGIARRSAYPFLLTGVFAQAITCYFLTIGTSAGVWTSVALANSLFIGRLADLHSVFWGKTSNTFQPGMKMIVPGSTQLLAIATFDRTTPRQGDLRPGFLLNLVGLASSVLGAAFQNRTRQALGFSPFVPTPAWVVFTSITLCLGLSLLIATTLIVQQRKERTWNHDSELPTRWVTYSTLISSCLVSGLAIFFFKAKLSHLWPILDAIVWLSDMNTLHMLLTNRWMMGAVASAVGSAA
ncbi:hypothetical protein C0993_010333 [Termitomyces sp. T159_Od127]|nr:hypothetical protein C0993_010333 [Termitomyces sp. T159_Od127]